MELFPITLPKSNICTETELYYRSSEPVQYEEKSGQLRLQEKAVLTLDTYFNCFSYQKYLQYTSARVLEVHLKMQGKARLRLMKAEQKGKKVQRTVLLTQQVRRERLEAVTLLYDFSQEAGNGFLYLEVTALSQEVVLEPGYYGSPIPTEQTNPTKLAAVICTYKREDYVKRNLQHLNQSIFVQPEQEIAEHLEVFVVDNGKTLNQEEIETKQIRLFPNKNCGGSGGFTRGIIEALRRKEEFSHVLLMDDDILLESNVLIKTIRFLQILRPEHQDLAIGGSMLRLDQMNVQHTMGDCWDGRRIINVKRDYNLIVVENLLGNELDVKVDYNAWWYACLPLCLINENELPLPLFVREDDVEYGLRLFDKWLHLNGIGVWHPPFKKKDNPIMEYYNTRNQLITNAIHFLENKIYRNLYILMRFVGKCLLRGNAYMVRIPFKGFDDYLKGIDWLQNQDSEQLHQNLVTYSKQLEQQRHKPWVYYFILAGLLFLRSAVKLILQQKHIVDQYREKLNMITSMTFWCEKLELIICDMII